MGKGREGSGGEGIGREGKGMGLEGKGRGEGGGGGGEEGCREGANILGDSHFIEGCIVAINSH